MLSEWRAERRGRVGGGGAVSQSRPTYSNIELTYNMYVPE